MSGSRILICAATLPELMTFPVAAGIFQPDTTQFHTELYDLLLTGVGIPTTLVSSLEALSILSSRMVVNIGIAGAYPGSGYAIGDVVTGVSEVYGDIGMELPVEPHFMPLRDTPFGKQEHLEPFRLSSLSSPSRKEGGYKVHTGNGCTVNSCTGTLSTGGIRARLFEADFETMEGAAVAHACALKGVPCCEIRAISNIASQRDMQPANIRAALANLRHYLSAVNFEATVG